MKTIPSVRTEAVTGLEINTQITRRHSYKGLCRYDVKEQCSGYDINPLKPSGNYTTHLL
jgi:hypothetical protein